MENKTVTVNDEKKILLSSEQTDSKGLLHVVGWFGVFISVPFFFMGTARIYRSSTIHDRCIRSRWTSRSGGNHDRWAIDSRYRIPSGLEGCIRAFIRTNINC
jgi:hypothetical protein